MILRCHRTPRRQLTTGRWRGSMGAAFHPVRERWQAHDGPDRRGDRHRPGRPRPPPSLACRRSSATPRQPGHWPFTSWTTPARRHRRDGPERLRGVELTELRRNAGYAVANNVVLRRSSAPFVLLLNPDTAVGEGALDRLVEVMRERPAVGLAGPDSRSPTARSTTPRSGPSTLPGALALGALAHFTVSGVAAGSAGASRATAPPAFPSAARARSTH